MGNASRCLLVVALAVGVASCTPVAAGPELPRPAQPAGQGSLPEAVTTTTVDAADVTMSDCPTDLCLVYHLDPAARWSDGSRVTADDLIWTAGVFTGSVASPDSPYAHISALDALDPSTLRLALDGPIGSWQDLFARVIPAGLSGDVAEWPTTGAYRMTEWVGGDRIVVERSGDWWSGVEPISGAAIGTVRKITFVFIDDPEEMVDALAAGDVDVIATRATEDLVARVDGLDDVTYEVAPGPFWEHIDFNHEDEMLGQHWVRQVIDLAIDRQEILDETVRLIQPGAPSLDNTMWMTGTEGYEPHYVDRHSPDAAEQMLIAHGCELDRDVYVCGETPMSFLWTTTNDDPARRAIFDLVRDDLDTVGIELLGDFRDPSAFVTRDHLFGGPEEWQMIDFSWRAAPDPASSAATYLCGDSDLNVNRYCSDDVEALVRSAATMADPALRAAAYNEADRLYLADLALIPLYQKPDLMAWSSDISGPSPNWALTSNLWNVAAWTGRDEIVVALDSEPLDLDPTATEDVAANTVLSTLLYGAFGMGPTQHHVPVLTGSVDVNEG
jgi:ABC-type transport system substrate-binding protein